MRARFPAARWLPPEKLHLTLVFLGATPSDKVEQIAGAVTTAAAGFEPFVVRTGEGGGFAGGRRGGVAWLRLSAGTETVSSLSRAIDESIGSSIYAVADPRPHLTLARGVDEPMLDQVRSQATQLRFEWTVGEVTLFRSYTDPHGSRYEALRAFRLD